MVTQVDTPERPQAMDQSACPDSCRPASRQAAQALQSMKLTTGGGSFCSGKANVAPTGISSGGGDGILTEPRPEREERLENGPRIPQDANWRQAYQI